MLKTIELNNVCSHESRRAHFGLGVTVMVGPQGCGKSTFVTMGLASVTGENPQEGPVSLNITHNAAGPSYGRSIWEINGHTVDVIRGYKRAKSQVFVDGENSLKNKDYKEAEVTQIVCNLLGCDKASVFDYSYVSQKNTAAVLNYKQTARVEFFAKLLGCDKLLSWNADLTKAINLLQGKVSHSYKSTLNELTVKKNRNATNLMRNTREHNESMVALAEVQRNLLTYASAIENAGKRASMISTRDAKMVAINKLLQSITDNTAKYVQYSEELESQTTQRALRSSMDSVIANNKVIQMRQQARDAAASELKSLVGLLVQPEEFVASHLAEVNTNIESLQSKRAELKSQESLAQLGSVCPTCKQPVSIAQDISSVRSELNKVTEDLNVQLRKRDKLTEVKFNWEQWVKVKEAREAAVLSKTEEIKQHDAFLAVNTQQVVSDEVANLNLEVIDQRVRTLDREAGSTISSINYDKKELARLQSEVDDINTQISQIPEIDQSALDAISQLTAREKELCDSISRLSEERQSLDAELNQIIGQATVVIAKYKEEKKSIRALEIGREMAAIVKPTNLPQKVLRTVVNKVATNMTGLCQALGQQMVISANDELEFVATKPSGRVELARRLSEGQQECLAFVFWVSRLISGMGYGLPLMIFDEPSAHMDVETQAQFGEMLRQLHPILVAAKKQVVVITHDRSLLSCGGGQIDMGA